MDRMILKMARQLNSFDEASLMSLWYEYAKIAQEFEPTKEWEEKTLALCLIQAIAWKNQLFNYKLAEAYEPDNSEDLPMFMPQFKKKGLEEEAAEVKDNKRKASILKFPTK